MSETCWEPDCSDPAVFPIPWSCPRCKSTGRAQLCYQHYVQIRRSNLRPMCDNCADQGRPFQRLVLESTPWSELDRETQLSLSVALHGNVYMDRLTGEVLDPATLCFEGPEAP